MAEAIHQTGRPLAVITGASSGIGAMFAKRLARRGYDLVLVARRKDRLDALGEELRKAHGIHTESLQADLAREDDLRRVERRVEQAAELQFLINNAGFGTIPLFHKADVEGQDRMHRVHVMATMRLTRAALPTLIARNKGYVVNVSSVAAFIHGPGSVSYGSTKAWMNHFTEGIHMELRLLGSRVRVQALCPGFTYTEFHDTLGLDRRFVSKGWWMPVEKVVDDSLAGLARGKLYVIPGLRYKLIVLLLQALPRAVVHAIAMRGPASRRKQAEAGQRARDASA